MIRKRLWGEILFYVVFSILGYLTLFYTDAFDSLYQFSQAHEEYELDELLLTLPILLVCLSVFALRRYLELRTKTRELRKTQQELQLAYDKVRNITKSKAKFMAIACHELNSPLSGAISAVRMVKHLSHGQEAEEFADLALDGMDNLRLLVGDVLHFAKLRERPEESDPKPFAVRATLESIARMGHQMAEEKGLRFKASLSSTLPDQLIADEQHVRIVVLNLIGNAVKFTDQGTVTLRCAYLDSPSNVLLIDVIDTGIGIPKDKQAIIFEPYEQGADDSMAKNAGLGLGLSVVREITDQLGGSVSLESAVGKGSTFSVRLPAMR